MSDVIAKNELKNFDGYEFDSYEDRADDEIVDNNRRSDLWKE